MRAIKIAHTAFSTYLAFWAYAIRPYIYSTLFKFKNSGQSLEFFSNIFSGRHRACPYIFAQFYDGRRPLQRFQHILHFNVR